MMTWMANLRPAPPTTRPLVLTCMVGTPANPCGKPATMVIAVSRFVRSVWDLTSHRGGVVSLCRDHADTPASQWDSKIEIGG